MNRLRRLLRRIENFIFARRAYKFVIRDWTALADLESLAAALRSTRFSQTVSPVVMDRPTGERILVIAPHPDDEIIGPGGTLVRAIRAGATVHVVYLTNATGQEGLDREADATAVANSLGYSIQFLGYEADALPATEETAGVLAAAINRFRPDNVFVSFFADDHVDHRKASELLFIAARAGVLPGPFEIWAYQVYSVVPANVLIDITDVKDAKADAIRMWKNSAMKSRDWAHYALGMNAYHSRFLPSTTEARYAEPFFVVPLEDYIDVCAKYFGDPAE